MATYTQKNRRLAVTTPLGPDALLLAGFSGREETSRLFHFDLDLLSEKESIAPADLVGKAVTVSLTGDGPARHFHGHVRRLSASSVRIHKLRQYKAEVVPWLWFLTQTADCRLFQNKTVPEIVEQIFKDLGFTAFETNLREKYVKWDYCVQYRETDFNFVSRLLEHEGIFYWFKHEQGKHTLVLADQASAYKDCPEKDVEYTAGSFVPNHVSTWEHGWEFRPGKWAHTDYNFEAPKTSLMANVPTTVKLPGNDKFEVYDHPGVHKVKGDGEALAKVRMQEEEAAFDVVSGTGGCRTFTPGGKFTLKKHEVASEAGKSYVLTSVVHAATDDSYTAGEGGAQVYENAFTCVPSSVVVRPARVTRKPTIQGPQTAVVVGPKGQEIYTDKYGRIKVQFHWDREGKKDENSSCWVRVAQPIAGRRWGASFWPRIGQEVVVEFLEGDPDRPLVTGCVYNADQMPPYQGDGPDAKHKNDNKVSGVKTSTTLGGAGFNELRFDDTKDKQQVFIHAERDYELRVKHDRTELVCNNQGLIVGGPGGDSKGGTLSELIQGDRNLTVLKNLLVQIGGKIGLVIGGAGGGSGGGGGGGTGGSGIQAGETVEVAIDKTVKQLVKKDVHVHLQKNRMEKVDENVSVTVVKDRKEKVQGNAGEEVVGKRNEKVGGDCSLEVGGNRKEKVGAALGLEVVGDRNEKVGGNQSLNLTGNQVEKVGGNQTQMVTGDVYLKGKNVVIEADAALTIKVGGNFVNISSASVAVFGTQVLLNSGGAPGVGVPGNPTAPAAPEAPTAPDAPQDPQEVEPPKPPEADNSASGQKSSPG